MQDHKSCVSWLWSSWSGPSWIFHTSGSTAWRLDVFVSISCFGLVGNLLLPPCFLQTSRLVGPRTPPWPARRSWKYVRPSPAWHLDLLRSGPSAFGLRAWLLPSRCGTFRQLETMLKGFPYGYGPAVIETHFVAPVRVQSSFVTWQCASG